MKRGTTRTKAQIASSKAAPMTKREQALSKTQRELRDAVKKDLARRERQLQYHPSQWLAANTARDGAWWVTQVQTLILVHSTAKPVGSDHASTNTARVFTDLVALIEASAPPDTVYDENMRTAAILAVICSLWYARVQRAKGYDPRRPLFFRQLAAQRGADFLLALTWACHEEKNDATYFPGQAWEYPFDPAATNGEFI